MDVEQPKLGTKDYFGSMGYPGLFESISDPMLIMVTELRLLGHESVINS